MAIDMESIMSFDNILYSVLYSSVTFTFGLAVLAKIFTNEFRLGFRSFLTLVILFLGEPFCQFFVKGPFGMIVFSFGCLFVYNILPSNHLSVANKSVLVTGCDSGFGHALVYKMDSIGMTVFAGFLHIDGHGAFDLKNKCSDRLVCLKLDVTDVNEIAAACNVISESVGDEGLWGLVNNSGVCYVGDLEMMSERIIRKMMDVNLFGAIAVTKSVLHLIRKAHGRIVNVSSMTGRMTFQSIGAYSMSKHALTAYSNALRLEMRRWGIHVSIVEPGPFRTGSCDESLLRSHCEEIWEETDLRVRSLYGRNYLLSQYRHASESMHGYSDDLTPVVRCIQSALLSKKPLAVYSTSYMEKLFSYLFQLIPVCLSDRVLAAVAFLPSDLKPLGLLPPKDIPPVQSPDCCD